MKKIIPIIVIALMCLTACSYNNKINESNSVWKVVRYGDYIGSQGWKEEWEYDIDTHLLKTIRQLDPEDNIVEYYSLENIDGEDRLVEYDADNKPGNNYYIFHYDDEGNVTGSLRYRESGVFAEYKYDLYGKVISKVLYKSDQTIMSKSEYDQNGNKTISLTYDKDEDHPSGYEKVFDDFGNLIKYSSYNNGQLVNQQEMEYDSEGSLIRQYFLFNYEKIYEYNKDKTEALVRTYNIADNTLISETKVDFENDSSGRWIRMVSYNEENKIVEISERLFDDSGHKIRETSQSGEDGMIYGEIWEYDSNGLLIKQGSYIDDEKGTAYKTWEYELIR